MKSIGVFPQGCPVRRALQRYMPELWRAKGCKVKANNEPASTAFLRHEGLWNNQVEQLYREWRGIPWYRGEKDEATRKLAAAVVTVIRLKAGGS